MPRIAPGPKRVISFRVHQDDWDILSEAARAAGLRTGAYARVAALGLVERLDVFRKLEHISTNVSAINGSLERLLDVDNGGALTKEAFKHGMTLLVGKLIQELDTRLQDHDRMSSRNRVPRSVDKGTMS